MLEKVSSLSFIIPIIFHLTVSFPAFQQQSKNEQEDIQHEVSVVLKLVQVYVTDEEGSPVKDLKRSDFVLFDNNKIQNITDFERHFLAGSDRADKTAPKDLVSPSGKTGGRMNRKFFIFLDTISNDDAGIIKAKKAALHFVDTQLQPDDEVGMLSFLPGTGINLHTYLTSDREKIREAIKNAGEVPVGKTPEGMTLAKEMSRAESEMAQQQAGTQKSGTSSAHKRLGAEDSQLPRPYRIRGMKDDSYKGHGQMVRDVANVAKALGFIPGYKHIIFFSGGGRLELGQAFDWMARELAAANCQVYTVDSWGPSSNLLGFNRPRKETLQSMASLTGGRHFADIEQYEVIAENIHSVTSNYYVLGYYIDERWDGRYHKIKVEVKRKGCQVFAQGGYYNPKPYSQYSELEKELHLIDLAFSDDPYSQVPLVFPLCSLPYSYGKQVKALILFKVDKERLEGITDDKTELFTLFIDSRNNVLDVSRGEIDFNSLPDKEIFCYTDATLPPGKFECRVVVRNLSTGKSAVGIASLDIREHETEGIELYPPLLLLPQKRASYLKYAKKGKKESVSTSIKEVYPVISNESSPAIDLLPNGQTELLAALRVATPGIIASSIAISASVTQHQTGKRIPLATSLLFSEKIDDIHHIMLLHMELPELAPGKYAFDLDAVDETSGASSRTARTLTILD